LFQVAHLTCSRPASQADPATALCGLNLCALCVLRGYPLCDLRGV